MRKKYQEQNMSFGSIEDILPLIERPSRYLGSEINSIRKDFSKIKLSIALAFPDLYEIGTSHFGLQILYTILNRHPEIAAERVFAPAGDLSSHLKASRLPLGTLESGRPLHQFDIIGFSLLYELNYTNILTMLELAGIPFYAARRGPSHPLIIAGGPCTCNPEPVADFFDAILIGDGEVAALKMAESWLSWKQSDNGDRDALLKMWSTIEGVYIPSFFEPHYDSGFQILLPKNEDYTKVSRTIVPDLNTVGFPEAPILPYGKPVHDRLRLEISRGCTRGCRFCQAGMIYRPVRERKTETLLAISEAALSATGYEDVSLLSLSTGDYGCIEPLMNCLMQRSTTNHTAISFPSIRAGTLTPELMNLIKQVRKTGFTIAPEAGSQRLRDVINKNITEKEIVDTVHNAFTLGWQVIKLYFMIGLPTEKDDDIRALVELVKNLRRIKIPRGRAHKRNGAINVSVTTFIPKPHTPFQWAPQASLSESKEKISWIQNQLNLPGIQFKWQNPEVSWIEGVWSRGDRRLSRLLLEAYRHGCRFDGWSDMFRFEFWQKAFESAGVDPAFYTSRSRDFAEPLPWDHVDTKVSKAYLEQEWHSAVAGTLTPDCRTDRCNQCGVCDFKHISPKVFSECPPAASINASAPPDPEGYQTFILSYAKTGQAKYFGHLELSNIFIRAIRRAAIPVKYSQGFHPMPKISFKDPLPVGLESRCEILYVTADKSAAPSTIVNGLNLNLPEGLEIIDCQPAPGKKNREKIESITYQVTLKNDFFSENELDCFNKKTEAVIEIVRPKGKSKKIDLKDAVLGIEMLAPNKLQLLLKSEPGKTIRPFEVVSNIFSLKNETLKRARCMKIRNN